MESNGSASSELDPKWTELAKQERQRVSHKETKRRATFRYQHINAGPIISPAMEEIIKQDYLTG